jgi:beta-xylosidase
MRRVATYLAAALAASTVALFGGPDTAGTFRLARQYAWAPAAVQRNGLYYLYLPVDRSKIGVARSTSPVGGFVDARGNPLIDEGRDANTGEEPIDPAVFVDDDGLAYMYFGQEHRRWSG